VTGALRILAIDVFVLAAAVFVAAEESHVRATLVSDLVEVRGGETFVLGVHFDPEPGWHIYWSNPGEAGLSTELRFTLPDGYAAGDVGWPLPVEFEQPGGIVGYGYEDGVVLAAEIESPANVGNRAAVAVEASWLACKDVCVLGGATLEAELPLAGDRLERSTRLLDEWSEELPTGERSATFELSVTGGPVDGTTPTPLTAWLNWSDDSEAVEVFPDPGPGLKAEGVRVQTRGRLTRVDLTVTRVKTSSTPADTLRVLVVHRDNQGDRHGSVVDLDLP
jgi:DsbC/DsbD-like thiol-disulfide interchange protein